ncbi:NAD(P)-binding protein [Gonapodya prolifera JEL478]|uniref:NAD(P)-binding protein n=1 Tax=Gonapodya prolifera (strain JEL478) TaxID=1344416 RepID=A0A139ATY9_GONPJ|nr:NAD(P)-binding protein [Gonapodya prolifera JEL478]|eukprot:KXS19965.1 NAD(P)-binding protein [Gonapodya prolifera JEL478]
MSEVKVFLTGATGYIGGQVLFALLNRADASRYKIAALIRGEERAQKLRDLGTRVVVGSLDDVEIIKKEASEADVVLHTAHADHMPSAKAIIAGLEAKAAAGKKGIYIHTSGTGVLADFAYGDTVNPTIFSDLDLALIDSLEDSQPHRDVDLVVRAAGASGKVDAYIVLPPTIYGIGDGPFNKISIQIPNHIRAAIQSGKAQYVGKGVARWSNVHISDLAPLYLTILDHALSHPQPSIPHPFEGYFFAETGEHSWGEAVAEIGRVLKRKGVIASEEAGTFGEDDVVTYLGARGRKGYGSNSRSRAHRGRKIGWTPAKKPEDFFKAVSEEVDYILANEKPGSKAVGDH